MPVHPSRRHFLQSTAFAGAGFFIGGAVAAQESKSPNSKLNLAHIGVGGRGGSSVGLGENVVALCDVDSRQVERQLQKHTAAKGYADFRKMFEEMAEKIDAVTVGTPDHIHAPACIAAMKLGKHIYVEKPLAHNVYECRMMSKVAKEKSIVSQLGNQHHADFQVHRAAQLIQADVIGKVKEVHLGHGLNGKATTVFPQQAGPALQGQSGRPTAQAELPAGLNWDLWLGPAKERPYHPSYCPFNWRGWRDFGTGGMGDFFCHFGDPAYFALRLQYPLSVEAVGQTVPYERFGNITVRYGYPMPDDPKRLVTVYWHGHQSGPPAELLDGEEGTCLLVGEKGQMLCKHAKNGGKDPLLLPKEKFKDVKLPEPTYKPVSHHGDWISAIKNSKKSSCDFPTFGAYLGEAAVLGYAALWAGKKLDYDGPNMKFTNAPDADQYLRREYRKGWDL